MSRMKSKQYYDVEEVYKELFPSLVNFAKNLLINNDDAIDAVHDAFSNIIEWKQKNPERPLNPKVIFGQVQRICHKMNRHTGMISLDDPAYAKYFRNRGLTDSPDIPDTSH